MKKIKVIVVVFVIAIFISFKTKAQDTIYPNPKGQLIIAKILEVNSDNLKYKKHAYLNGPTYTIKKSNIEKVIYKNGTIETYTIEKQTSKDVDRQESEKLMPGSKVFLEYSYTKRIYKIV